MSRCSFNFHVRLGATKANEPASKFLWPARRRLLVAQGQGQQALTEYQQARADKQLPKDPTTSETVAVLTESAWLQMAAGHAAGAERQARHAPSKIAQGQSAEYESQHSLALADAPQALADCQRSPGESPNEALAQAQRIRAAQGQAVTAPLRCSMCETSRRGCSRRREQFGELAHLLQ